MIRPHSKARQKQLREYFRERQVFLLARSCEAHQRIWGNAMIVPAADIHHTHGRIGALLLDKSKWMRVCRLCHGWINANPAKARDRGLLAERGQWNQTEKLRQQKERNAHA